MRSFRDLSIRHKFTLLLVGVTTLVLLSAAAAIVFSERINMRERMKLRYATLANVFEPNATGTLEFAQGDNERVDQSVLENLAADPDVVFGGLYNANAELAAEYLPPDSPDGGQKLEDARFKQRLPQQLSSDQIEQSEAKFTDDGFLDVIEKVTRTEADGTQTVLGWLYLRASTQQLQTQIWRSLRITGIVLLLAIGLALLLAYVSQRVVTAPILRLVEATTLVSAGHDYTIRVEKSSNDELGTLCDSFNSMLADVQQKEEDLERGNKELEDSVKEISSTLEQLRQREDQLERTNRELDRTVQAIREAVGQLSTMGRQLSATVAEQSSGAQEQAASVSETTSTVNELAATSSEAADTAKSAGEAARRTLEVGEQGRQAVADCIAAMQVVNEHVQITADNTLTLAERAHAIGEIIGTVKSIAEQTNILALNAAIEASRAGEHGRGFAVVANDVKQLADQSKKATAQIREILGQIQDATNKTVLSTEQGTKSVKEAREVVTQAGETIDTLAKALEQSSVAATQIVTSSRQQSQAVNQVTSAMQDIDQITQKAVAATRQVEQMASSLAALATQLSEIVAEHESVLEEATV